ncbi:MAG: PepSY domain-containing protein [Burkholderiales bacterium]|nr:MAG: PepSY domain-containing protein [Burkholderiales bacterium]
MRTSRMLSTLVAVSVLATGAAVLLPAVAQTTQAPSAAANTTPSGQPLTIVQLHERLEAAGYSNIRKIEAERDRFEVYATNREGQRVELDVDIFTGQVLRSETRRGDDQDRSDRDDRRESGSGAR